MVLRTFIRFLSISRPERLVSLADEIASLNMMEACELSKILAEKLKLPDQWMAATAGVRDAGPGAASTDDDDEGAKEQKTSFTVHLKRFEGDKKVALIKEVKAILPDMNLVQAKKFVESLPHPLKDNIGKAEAEEIAKRVEALGGVCSIE